MPAGMLHARPTSAAVSPRLPVPIRGPAMFARIALLLVAVALLVFPPAVLAGMPSPIPSNPEKVYRLNESPLLRLQTISFFCAGFLVCALVVQAIWNSFRRDFPGLPRLTFAKAAGSVFLWGLLFVIVLTMISGARELMTPGAWKKQGFTYKLTEDMPAANQPPLTARRHQALERLRTSLWQYAATHSGRFPARVDLPRQDWEVPEAFGMEYGYVLGLSADHAPALLAYEPELQPGVRFVLFTNGDISTADSSEIKSWLKRKSAP